MRAPKDYYGPGAPAAGTNEVQTLTIGGTPTSGDFRLGVRGYSTADIAWSATNATLLANINAMSGKYDQAIQLSRKVHSMPHENFAVAHYIAGMAFQAKNELTDAAVEYRQYLKEAPQGKSADNARNALAAVEQKLAVKR